MFWPDWLKECLLAGFCIFSCGFPVYKVIRTVISTIMYSSMEFWVRSNNSDYY